MELFIRERQLSPPPHDEYRHRFREFEEQRRGNGIVTEAKIRKFLSQPEIRSMNHTKLRELRISLNDLHMWQKECLEDAMKIADKARHKKKIQTLLDELQDPESLLKAACEIRKRNRRYQF